MGLFTSKIVVGVLAGGFTLAGAGLLFNGSTTLQNASTFVQDAGNKITQYESNEGTLVSKLSTLRTIANSKIDVANASISEKKAKITELQGQITQLQTDKTGLESQVALLGAQIASLQDDLTKSNTDLAATKIALTEKINQYNLKVADLDKANNTIAELNKTLLYVKNKAVEADGHIAKLEGELKKANDEVAAHGVLVDKVKEETKDDQPLASQEVDSIDTTVTDVNSQQ